MAPHASFSKNLREVRRRSRGFHRLNYSLV